MIIAIDGPAASGKGTLAKKLAAHYALRHLDTGLIYRAVAKAMLERALRLDDVEAAVAIAKALDPAKFDDAAVKRPGGGATVLAFQRGFGRGGPGAVLDGRDIGTVIFPQAEVKIFVTATPETRARRRAAELASAGEAVNLGEIMEDIRARDERDSARAIAPLRPAPDAHLLDTTHLDIDAAFRAAVDIVEAVRAGRKRG